MTLVTGNGQGLRHDGCRTECFRSALPSRAQTRGRGLSRPFLLISGACDGRHCGERRLSAMLPASPKRFLLRRARHTIAARRFVWCARHGAQRRDGRYLVGVVADRGPGGGSPLRTLVMGTVSRTARASPRGGVRRKLQAKCRPDEQEAHRRRPHRGEGARRPEARYHPDGAVVDAPGLWHEGRAPYPGRSVALPWATGAARRRDGAAEVSRGRSSRTNR